MARTPRWSRDAWELQRAHLINNARPFKTIGFAPNTDCPLITVASTGFPVTTINLLENTAQSWYDAGSINLRRRCTKGS
ncbi:MAG TPA: hypothetical protein VE083_06980 [Terriglobales bacterium]|nr:hypothetical protein [Terriglobales bacterium]